MPTLPIIAVFCATDSRWFVVKYADKSTSNALPFDSPEAFSAVHQMTKEERSALCYAQFCSQNNWIEV